MITDYFFIDIPIYKNNYLYVQPNIYWYLIINYYYSNLIIQNVGGHKIPYCFKNPDKSRIGFDCVIDNDYPLAIDLYKLLKTELNRRAIANKCENHSIKSYMTERDIINYVSTKSNFKVKQINAYFIYQEIHLRRFF